MSIAPVITIDGPSGTGKGTIAQQISAELNWHYLDSGAIYRAMAWSALNAGIDIDDEQVMKSLLDTVQIDLQLSTEGVRVICQETDISAAIRSEEVGLMASRISSNPLVRKRLLELQLDARRSPGLVADGRDMGTVIFPDAALKFFLDASLEERAQRRYKQLQMKGLSVNFAQIEADLKQRDERDRTRSISPALPAKEAVIIDTTHMAIDEVMDVVRREIQASFKLGAL